MSVVFDICFASLSRSEESNANNLVNKYRFAAYMHRSIEFTVHLFVVYFSCNLIYLHFVDPQPTNG